MKRSDLTQDLKVRFQLFKEFVRNHPPPWKESGIHGLCLMFKYFCLLMNWSVQQSCFTSPVNLLCPVFVNRDGENCPKSGKLVDWLSPSKHQRCLLQHYYQPRLSTFWMEVWQMYFLRSCCITPSSGELPPWLTTWSINQLLLDETCRTSFT